MKEKIEISLTEFLNFVNKSGSAKATVVRSVKRGREEDYESFKDYLLPFRNKLREAHKEKKPKDFLNELIGEVNPEKRSNYSAAVLGYLKYWGRKKIEWVDPSRKVWSVGDLRISLNPELGLIIKDQIYIIKLFLKTNETLDKKHADLILNLMEKELRPKVGGKEPIFAVLDVKRAKLFQNRTKDISLYPLLKGEARSFESQWKDID